MRTSEPQGVTVRRPSLLFVILIIIPSCPPLAESSSLPIFVPIIVSIVVFLHLRPDRRLDRRRLASRFVSAILPFINRKSPANPGSAPFINFLRSLLKSFHVQLSLPSHRT